MHPLDSLRLYMAECGLPFDGEFVLDGQIQRYTCQGKRSDNPEWYVGFILPSGHVYCTFSSWRFGKEPYNFRSSGDKIDEEEKEYIAQKTQEIEENWAKKHAEAAKLAVRVFNACDPFVSSHPYLQKKQIKPRGIRQKDGWLYVPVCDLKGNIHSVQKIGPNSEKMFLPDGKVKGHFFIIGDVQVGNKIFIAEGLATAASIYESTGIPTVVAFSAGNLLRIGHEFTTAFPFKSITLCADLGAAGDKSVRDWQEHINQSFFQPNFHGKGKEKDKDFNDLACHSELGRAEVKKQLSPSIKDINLKDIMSISKPVEWLIENLIIKGSVNMIFAPPAAGKSAICHSLAFASSQGIKFWKYHPKKCHVLYVDGELSYAENKSRWESIMRRHAHLEEIDETTLHFVLPETIFSTFDNPINLYEKEWQARLDPLIEKADLIFLDNISTLTGDNGDPDYENKASSWVNVGSWLRGWKMKGKSFILVHHANRAGTARGTTRMSVDTMTQIKLEPIEITDERIEIYTKVVFEKRREISGSWKFPFKVKLVENEWEIE